MVHTTYYSILNVRPLPTAMSRTPLADPFFPSDHHLTTHASSFRDFGPCPSRILITYANFRAAFSFLVLFY